MVIDNTSEVEEGYNYKHYKRVDTNIAFLEFYSGSEVIINGQKIENPVRIVDEPPLIKFIIERKQYTILPHEALETPLSKSFENMLIENYILRQITRAKNGSRSKFMLYETIYKECDLESKWEISRAKNTKIPKLLDHYKEIGIIHDWKEETNSKGEKGIKFSIKKKA